MSHRNPKQTSGDAPAKRVKSPRTIGERVSQPIRTLRRVDGPSDELVALRGTLDQVSSAVITIDRDFYITQVNAAARSLFARCEAEFRKQWPSFSAERIVGTNVDIFSENPAQQRALLADPGRLPHRVDIAVGALRLQINTTAIHDGTGQLAGNVQEWTDVTDIRRAQGLTEAISRSNAVIEFDLDGNVRAANDNFLHATGYRLDEIVGRHHRIFCSDAYTRTPEYAEFWAKLRRGEFVAGEFQRFDKNGTEIWLQAAYNPIADRNGRPFLVVKTAADITAQKQRNADYEGQIAAISKSQAVIEFDMTGVIRHANANFLGALGYTLDEIKGHHHSMFVDEAFRRSPDYADFWARLARGEFVAGEFKRIGKGGREVWIQASYNPILDASGKPMKVVKYATDVTRQVNLRTQISAVLAGVGRNASSLAAASDELSAVSQQMSANAEETSAQASAVSAASAQVSGNVQTVASGTEEMSASIREIAKNAADGARVATQAVDVAARTNATIMKLGESSGEIGKVIKVITSIAHQTKLLALNATIEAARAGEAGKGFAVVANEVKELAKETGQATEDISQKIEAIQADSNGAIAAIAQISAIIDQINDIQGSIASAVEEQTATTNEMSRNLAETAAGSGEITRNITGMAQAARDTSMGASRALEAARALNSMAGELQDLVSSIDTDHNGGRKS